MNTSYMAPSVPGTTLASADLKTAQQNSVNRFLGLWAILGDALLRPGRVAHADAGLDTPLPLLRGLDWTVSCDARADGSAEALSSVYRLPVDPQLDPAGADLVLTSEPARVADLVEAMGPAGLLVVTSNASSPADACRAAIGRALARDSSAGGMALLAEHCMFGEQWFLIGNRDRCALGQEAFAGRTRDWLDRAARLSDRGLRRLIGERKAGIVRGTICHPHGVRNSAYRAWTFKRRLEQRIAPMRTRADEAFHHFGVHAPANAGDRVLFEAVRSAIAAGSKAQFLLQEVRRPVTADLVRSVNRGRGVIIGGGGLFLADTVSSSASGWQWNIATPLLRRIEVPMVVFAVGYNRFRNQGEFPQVFVDSLKELVSKSSFVGIRNRGSIAALSEYLPPELAARLAYQPCPTTVMSYLDIGQDPEPAEGPRKGESEGPRRLAVNAAFDRYALRMAGREKQTLGGIARAARLAQDMGWRVTLVGHLFDDEAVAPYLARAGVDFDVVHLTGASTARVLDFYRGIDLVMGMRGHAQMIPFGLGIPIISLVAHDKMRWFLDDIGHPEWGADFRDQDFAERLEAQFVQADSDLEERRGAVARARAALWEVTSANVVSVRRALGLGA